MRVTGRRKDGPFARSAKGRLVDAPGRLVDAPGRLGRASFACSEKAAR